jgi:putative transposase
VSAVQIRLPALFQNVLSASFKSGYRTLKIEVQVIELKRVEKDLLYLLCSKLKGLLKVRLHRSLPQGFSLKNILISKKADSCYCTLCLNDPTVPVFVSDEIIPSWDNYIGIDAVLYEDHCLATSEYQKLPSLKSFRKNQKELAKISHYKNNQKKGCKARRKVAKKYR